jgi:ATP-dependent DNA helicase RecQ
MLAKSGISADYYHAGLNNQHAHRSKMLDHGHIRVMVATNAFGMGIDKRMCVQ